jgi:hypothetical protein
MSQKTLGRLAYERYSGLTNIGEQRHKNGLEHDHSGPMPWEKLTPRARHHWEEFAKGFARDVMIAIANHKADAERRVVRADLFEREVRRRMAELQK